MQGVGINAFGPTPGYNPGTPQGQGQSQPEPSIGYQGFAYQGIVNNATSAGNPNPTGYFDQPFYTMGNPVAPVESQQSGSGVFPAALPAPAPVTAPMSVPVASTTPSMSQAAVHPLLLFTFRS